MARARTALLLVVAPALVLGCASADRRTLADLRRVEPDMTEVRVENGLEQAMRGYEAFLSEAPVSSLTPEAMRRLADLKLEREYGILGGGSGPEASLPGHRPGVLAQRAGADAGTRAPAPAGESERAFEERATRSEEIAPSAAAASLELPGGGPAAGHGPLEAIALYDRILAAYPDYPHNDRVLYQKARAFDELGRSDEAVEVIEQLVAAHPDSRFIDEVQFRRAEYFFVRKRFYDAELAYAAVTRMGAASPYYELALYKLGWALYKQEMHEEALHQYVALLDHKVATGYDWEQSEDEADQRRIADTYRVVSLSFSSLGGPGAVADYFRSHGARSYEDRIYRELGEFYFEKLRYHDAAEVYTAFVELYPLHESAPLFGMRKVEIYEAGGFPRLVLDAKKDFAARYGLQSAYWQGFGVEERPEVIQYLKANLEDLATHYHAQFQDEELSNEKQANFAEALDWYRAYLASFPDEAETPGIHYQLADLLLENEHFDEAASEYERTAYDYPAHERAAGAGYAAIFAHRESQRVAPEVEVEAVKRRAVASTLRFVDVFPEHEHAAVVLGTAVDDLYDMQELALALETGRRLIESYPAADPAVRRGAWAAVANASFDLEQFVDAESAYTQVLEMTGEDDESRQAVADSLAAAVYKQGEQASAAGEHRAAADHFLRIADVAPGSEIRPAAEYDAGAALMRLEDWTAAAEVLDRFRERFPEHELQRDATKQMAFIYREQGDLASAAGEYERVADDAGEPELRREALLLAGELYEDAEAGDRALAVYLRYVGEFPQPLETAVETRFKIAGLHEGRGDDEARRDELRRIVRIDREAGAERTPRIRYLAARSALVLTESLYEDFASVRLVQPFDRNLREKQRRMDRALQAFDGLVAYEVAEVTAAATYYIAEIYSDLSGALMESERPTDLSADQLLDYEMALEEEAFPFEERAIGVHEKNLELMGTGIWNDWIDQSLQRLATLMPGRYAKPESSPGPIATLDRYAYRVPGRSAESLAGDSTAPAATPADGEETTPVPAPAADEPAVAGPPPAAPAPGRAAEPGVEPEPAAEPVPADGGTESTPATATPGGPGSSETADEEAEGAAARSGRARG